MVRSSVLVGCVGWARAEVGRAVRLQQREAHGADARGRGARPGRHAVRHARAAEDAPAVPAVDLDNADQLTTYIYLFIHYI